MLPNYKMKLNLRKIKLNQIILIVAILVVLGWNIRRARRVEKLEGEKSEAVLYVENTEEPNPFIVYGMARKMTDDEAKLEEILNTANDGKKDKLIELLNSL
jgi:hypothetical protein